jgi:hypothetical protein
VLRGGFDRKRHFSRIADGIVREWMTCGLVHGQPASMKAGALAGSVLAGGVYFAGVFALGFALGIVRVLITGPKLGETAALLLEVPVILTASWFASKCCVAVFSVPPSAPDRLTMGFAAFSLTMLAELALSVMLFAHTVPEHFATYTHFPGLTGLAAQALFALIPYVQSARRCP